MGITISSEGTLGAKDLDELYQEALSLSNSIVEYFKLNKKEKLHELSAENLGCYTIECNRVTTGVMQAMSWCLMQKGVASGEITVEEATKKERRLSDVELFSAAIGCDTTNFPEEFVDYSDCVRALYGKIVRIDRLLYEGGSDRANPVHKLIEKIEKNKIH